MARNYSTRDFFRQMPNDLLARYFHRQDLLSSFDFSALKEANPEPLFEAWLGLPENLRGSMDADFQVIHDMCCEKGTLAIFDEANWQLRDDPNALAELIARFSTLPNHYHRAMITFLEYPQFWDGATRFYHADSLSYWRKRKNMGHLPAKVDEASVSALAEKIKNYFHTTEGRGSNCVVEPFRRGERDYFFAYPEDYSKQSVEWVDGKFGRRPHNPAFEIIYVYSQKEGTLDVNFRGPKKNIEVLQSLFATTVLGLHELPPDPKDERVYDLNSLTRRNFAFAYSAGSGIEDVFVKKLRLSSRFKMGERITIETDSLQNRNRIYDLFDKINEAVFMNLYNVTQAEIVALVSKGDGNPPKQISIRVSYPNSCSLKYDEAGLKLRTMLETSGIEPREQLEDADPETPVSHDSDQPAS